MEYLPYTYDDGNELTSKTRDASGSIIGWIDRCEYEGDKLISYVTKDGNGEIKITLSLQRN